jgi:hypothetical protein
MEVDDQPEGLMQHEPLLHETNNGNEGVGVHRRNLVTFFACVVAGSEHIIRPIA